jgi:hypothetical protein
MVAAIAAMQEPDSDRKLTFGSLRAGSCCESICQAGSSGSVESRVTIEVAALLHARLSSSPDQRRPDAPNDLFSCCCLGAIQ